MILGFIDGALKGRIIAIIVLTLVSGGSFALGYHVGKVDSPEIPETSNYAATARVPSHEETGAPSLQVPAPEEIEDVEEKEVVTEQEPRVLRPAVEMETKEPEPPPERTTGKKVAQPKVIKGKPYTVQAGVFSERPHAESFAGNLKRKGYGAFIEENVGSDNAVFRVKVGWFRSRDEAAAEAAKLKREEGLEAFVTGPN